jgi:hypothetical protein
MSVPHFVSLEVGSSDTLGRLGLLANLWQCALIAVLRMETVVHVALEAARAMKPGTGANEDVPGKPLWTVVTRRGTAIRSDVIITIGTFRSYSDGDADLSFCPRDSNREADSSNSS